jgi:hypothetical protein
LFGGFHSIHQWHLDIHENNIWLKAFYLRDRELSILCLSNNFQSRFIAKRNLQGTTNKGMIVNK